MRSVLLNLLQNIDLDVSVDVLNALDPRQNFGPLFDLQSRLELGRFTIIHRKGAVSSIIHLTAPMTIST